MEFFLKNKKSINWFLIIGNIILLIKPLIGLIFIPVVLLFATLSKGKEEIDRKDFLIIEMIAIIEILVGMVFTIIFGICLLDFIKVSFGLRESMPVDFMFIFILPISAPLVFVYICGIGLFLRKRWAMRIHNKLINKVIAIHKK